MLSFYVYFVTLCHYNKKPSYHKWIWEQNPLSGGQVRAAVTGQGCGHTSSQEEGARRGPRQGLWGASSTGSKVPPSAPETLETVEESTLPGPLFISS